MEQVSRESKQKLVIGVMTNGIQLWDRWNAVWDTWFNDYPETYFYTLSNTVPKPRSISLSDKYTDCYWTITQKHFLALGHMFKNHPDSEFYLLVLDDTFLFVQNLFHYIERLDYSEKLYIGEGSLRVIGLSEIEYASGAAILFSNPLVKQLNEYGFDNLIERWFEHCKSYKDKNAYTYSDMAYGYFTYTLCGIKLTPCSDFYSQPPNLETNICNSRPIVPYPICFHYIKPDFMRELYSIKSRFERP